jgi:thioredoxin reductase (NADPH)
MGFVWNTVVDEIVGDDKVTSVNVRNVVTGETDVLTATGVFIFIGHYPNSGFLKGVVDLDDQGYVIVDSHMRTSAPGVFAAGEIMDPQWRQVATSVGQGAAAGMACQHYVDALD